MSLDRYRIERAVIFRVPGIEKINSIESGVGTISLFVGNEEGQATKEILDLTKEIVEKNRPLGTRVLVEPFSKSPFQDRGLYELPNEIKNAHISSLTHSDIEFLVKSCVPNVVYFDSQTVKGGVIDVFVADFNLKADIQMLEKTQKVLNDVFHSDVTISVYEFDNEMLDSHKVKRKNVFLQSNRFNSLDYEDNHIRNIAKLDEERFSDQLGEIINGEIKYKSIIDNKLSKKGTVFVDSFISEEQLTTLLTLYSKVYYPISQDMDGYNPNIRPISTEVIMELARRGRIIPIFMAPLHHYKSPTVRMFLEDSNINVILPRQLDGLTILTLAKQFPFWKIFRENPQVAAEISHNVCLMNNNLLENAPNEFLLTTALTETTETHIQVADSGEAWFMEKGHIAAGNITAGGVIESLVTYLGNKLPKEISDTILIESHVYSMQLSIARALGAVFYPSIVHNEQILNLVSRLHAGPESNLLVPKINEMGSVLSNLKIIRPESVPILDYLEVIDDYEVKKLRQIITGLINKSDGSVESLMQQVEIVNNDVRKWHKSKGPFISQNVDILGLGLELALLPTGGVVPPFSTSFIGLILKAVLGDKITNSPLGNIEDHIYSKIGGVSPAALRIQRIRSNIQKIE
ncbi:hypothetical protein ACEWK1_22595 [Metabacillus sp. YM-086]|uniref:hypothetical protein n=1 Tax=Metabacillus sp. YM-086 TaxID=3341729 RepID=UPI003A83A5AA